MSESWLFCVHYFVSSPTYAYLTLYKYRDRIMIVQSERLNVIKRPPKSANTISACRYLVAQNAHDSVGIVGTCRRDGTCRWCFADTATDKMCRRRDRAHLLTTMSRAVIGCHCVTCTRTS